MAANAGNQPDEPAGQALPSAGQENIKVAVRLRPFTEKEKQRQSKRIVDIEQNTVALYSPKYDENIKKFTFDLSYWSHDGFKRSPEAVNVPDPSHPNSAKYVGQEKVFADLGRFLLANALQGYNSALLAYGQTGSGKSYTVSGYGQNEGILPRFARELFAELDRLLGEPSASAEEEGGGREGEEAEPAVREAAAQQQASEPPPEAGHSPDGRPAGRRQSRARRRRNRYEVYFSMIEIYNEVVRDLLAKQDGYQASANAQLAGSMARRGLRVREHPKRGFFVENLSSYPCASKEEIECLIEEGQLNKSIAATSMNETSSRGHTIYEFHIRQFRLKPAAATEADTGGADERPAGQPPALCETLTTSVVQLVDLAGSERVAVDVIGGELGAGRPASRSNSPFGQPQAQREARATSSSSSSTLSNQASGSRRPSGHTSGQQHLMNSNHQQRFKESVSINQSLSALGNCIQVLSQFSQQLQMDSSGANSSNTNNKQPKIPYRDSVLTKLLNRCCLSGNSKVVLIATLSPAAANYDDTLSTLRFADRAKQIRTHAVINRSSRGAGEGEQRQAVNALQRENERLKQILDGRVTRSDDSSQTSNFDDSENMIENFNGPKVGGTSGGSSGGSTPPPPPQFATAPDGGKQSPALKDRNATITRARTTTTTKAAPGAAGASQQQKTTSNHLRQAQDNLAQSKRRPANEKGPSRTSSVTASSRTKQAGGKGQQQSRGRLKESASNPSLALDSEQMKQLVSSATKKTRQSTRDLSSLAHADRQPQPSAEELELAAGLLDEIDLIELANIIDEENLLSPDSDDSFSAGLTFDENMTKEEKIAIINRLLNNSSVAGKFIRRQLEQHEQAARPPAAGASGGAGAAEKTASGRLARPKRAGAKQRSQRDANAEIHELKKTNPYLSNLNPDEQLTGVISHIIRPGEMIVGKNGDCDLLVYGPGLRGRHAKLTRLEREQGAGGKTCEVHLEPILPEVGSMDEPTEATDASAAARRLALMVNGEPVLERTRLKHSDRVLFGSTAYFVFVDSQSATDQSGSSVDLITYEQAHQEVLKKVMSDAENEAVIREIKDYTHRPGTGKARAPRQQPATGELAADQRPDSAASLQDDSGKRSRLAQNKQLARSLTIHGSDEADRLTGGAAAPADSVDTSDQNALDSEQSQRLQLDRIKEEEDEQNPAARARDDPALDELYRAKLMADTYEFAMPIAEANAIAKEMGIKVTYGLKILTGEEQLLVTEIDLDDREAADDEGEQEEEGEDVDQQLDGHSQSQADVAQQDDKSARQQALVSSREPIKPSSLDLAPELYVHVRLDELGVDFYWSKEKFQERRIKMLELYGAWDVGGKSGLVEYLIEQSKSQGYYMIDPFIDHVESTWVLIGHAQVTLQPVLHMSPLVESFDILDVNDELVGSVQIEALPCRHDQPASRPTDSNQDQQQQQQQQQQSYQVLQPAELAKSFLKDPRQLLGKPLVFLLKIVDCSDVPDRFAQIFCQYTLNRDQTIVRTKLARRLDQQRPQPADHNSPARGQPIAHYHNPEVNKLEFNHEHFVVIDQLDEETMDFLSHGFLTIQLVGLYNLQEDGQAAGKAASSASSSRTSAGAAPATTSSAQSLSGQSQASSPSQPTLVSTIISSINKYRFRMEQRSAGSGAACQMEGSAHHQHGLINHSGGSIYANSLTDSAKSANYRASSSAMVMNHSNSGASSVTSASATINLFDQQNDDEEGINSLNGNSQESIIDMILTKRKLDRAENQLHYIKRTINIAEHYNKKHIPVRTVKKLLNSYGQEMEGGSLEEIATEVTTDTKSGSNKHSNCVIQ